MASAAVTAIESVDAFTRSMYKRARNAGSNFEDVSTAVRDLHTVLKHLKIEAEDAESPLNGESSAIYSRQVTDITNSVKFTLMQLEIMLNRHVASAPDKLGMGTDCEPAIFMNDSERGWTMLDSEELEKIDLIRNKFSTHKLNIDMFLDTVQLHNPSKSRKMVDTESTELEVIKDKVDAIATRLYQRKELAGSESEEQLWKQFRDALEEDGFSRDVLRKNQDILRAYIRQVDEQATALGGRAPSVRRFLENYHPSGRSDRGPVYPAYSAPTGSSDDEIAIDDEEFFPSSQMQRLRDGDFPSLQSRNTGFSYDQDTSDDQDAAPTSSMALISTRELMALDKKSNELAVSIDNMRLYGASSSGDTSYITSVSPTHRILPPSSSRPLRPASTDRNRYEYEAEPPRYLPPLSAPQVDNSQTSSPALHPKSTSAAPPVADLPGSSLPTQRRLSTTQRPTILGPDSEGRAIPLDAKWTRIRRSLVSPEVLAREGLRYEARPEFVAILGELKKEEIAVLARKTAVVRQGRLRSSSKSNGNGPQVQARGEGQVRQPEDRYHPDKYRNWDVISSQRERDRDREKDKSLQDREKDKTLASDRQSRPRRDSGVSSHSDLWDSDSDDRYERSEDSYGSYNGARSRRYSNTYHQLQPSSSSSSRRQEPTARSRGNGETTTVPDGENDDQEKGTKSYPIIAPIPTREKGKDIDESKSTTADKTSPSATVMPKSILKNRNDEPHVRFNPEPQIFDENSLPRSMSRSFDRRDKGRTYRDDDRERDRDRDREKRSRSDRSIDRSTDRDRDRDRERERRSQGSSRSGKYYSSSSSRRDRDRYRDDRDRDRDRDRERDRERDRGSRRKARSETLRTVGIGGAAASLLSVLTEAAAGL
ncbi:hypothetical protein F5Y17DRAFT_467218 [Xylariaceae sp. FL0594]|nr:hypothetical protein F5Y17DRAFT_467218 [Xylariaceae sp. FL0594]